MARPRGRMICRRGQGANPAKSDTWRDPWEDGEDREDKSRLHVCARAKGVSGCVGERAPLRGGPALPDGPKRAAGGGTRTGAHGERRLRAERVKGGR